jgi:hypothetical protein
MQELLVRLKASTNASEFHDSTWLDVSVACTKVFEDIRPRNRSLFGVAWADYCDQKKRELQETSDRFFQTFLHGGSTPVQDSTDRRTLKEKMQGALERLIECSK